MTISAIAVIITVIFMYLLIFTMNIKNFKGRIYLRLHATSEIFNTDKNVNHNDLQSAITACQLELSSIALY